VLSIQEQIIAYNKTGRSNLPSYIVVHDTGDPGATAQNEHDYFSGGDRQASADFFVDSNNIIQIIDTDNNYSWHCGDGHGAYGISNSNSLGIEMCLDSSGNPTEATMSNTIDLIKYLMSKYGVLIDRVVRHYDASRKDCPGSFSSNNWAKWYEFKSKITQSSYTADFIKSVQHDLQKVSCLVSGEVNATGVLDTKTKAAITQFKYIVDLPGDSTIDDILISALNSITKKPTIGAGWTPNIIATKFIQWYIGIPKTGTFDANTVLKVKTWQVKAGIWSASGADGVIRDKDWNKILK